MATSAASYRNPQPEQNNPQPEQNNFSLTPGEVAQTIDELIQLGLVEAFRGEHNIVRYRPTNGRIA